MTYIGPSFSPSVLGESQVQINTRVTNSKPQKVGTLFEFSDVFFFLDNVRLLPEEILTGTQLLKNSFGQELWITPRRTGIYSRGEILSQISDDGYIIRYSK